MSRDLAQFEEEAMARTYGRLHLTGHCTTARTDENDTNARTAQKKTSQNATDPLRAHGCRRTVAVASYNQTPLIMLIHAQ